MKKYTIRIRLGDASGILREGSPIRVSFFEGTTSERLDRHLASILGKASNPGIIRLFDRQIGRLQSAEDILQASQYWQDSVINEYVASVVQKKKNGEADDTQMARPRSISKCADEIAAMDPQLADKVLTTVEMMEMSRSKHAVDRLLGSTIRVICSIAHSACKASISAYSAGLGCTEWWLHVLTFLWILSVFGTYALGCFMYFSFQEDIHGIVDDLSNERGYTGELETLNKQQGSTSMQYGMDLSDWLDDDENRDRENCPAESVRTQHANVKLGRLRRICQSIRQIRRLIHAHPYISSSVTIITLSAAATVSINNQQGYRRWSTIDDGDE